MMNESPTLKLAKSLIECPSITPLDAGCQSILAERLRKLGFEVQHLNFEDVSNLWAIRGKGNPIFVFAGHTDVVPAGNLNDWDSPPFSPTVKDGYLYGRGAADMKGSLAAMITACERFIQMYPDHIGSIAFLITSDEEGPAKQGTVKVVEYLKKSGIDLDYCLIGEPSSHQHLGDTIKIGRRGSYHGHLKIIGKEGHIAYPHKAQNPIHLAFSSLAALTEMVWDMGNEFFPPTSFQISNIAAGNGTLNVIPSTLECNFNFRYGTAISPEKISSQIKEILDQRALKYELNFDLSGKPFLSKSGKLLDACQKALADIVNQKPNLSTDGGTSDGRFIAEICPELIELGPCNESIHCNNERVKIEDLEQLSRIYERILQFILKV